MPVQARDGIDFLPACLHTYTSRIRGYPEWRPPLRWTSSLNLAQEAPPGDRGSRGGLLRPTAKGQQRASAQDSSEGFAGKAPRLLGQASRMQAVPRHVELWELWSQGQ